MRRAGRPLPPSGTTPSTQASRSNRHSARSTAPKFLIVAMLLESPSTPALSTNPHTLTVTRLPFSTRKNSAAIDTNAACASNVSTAELRAATSPCAVRELAKRTIALHPFHPGPAAPPPRNPHSAAASVIHPPIASTGSHALPGVRRLAAAPPPRNPHPAAASLNHPPIARTGSHALPGVRRLAAAPPPRNPHSAAASVTARDRRRNPACALFKLPKLAHRRTPVAPTVSVPHPSSILMCNSAIRTL
jgi:hypothetical protein